MQKANEGKNGNGSTSTKADFFGLVSTSPLPHLQQLLSLLPLAAHLPLCTSPALYSLTRCSCHSIDFNYHFEGSHQVCREGGDEFSRGLCRSLGWLQSESNSAVGLHPARERFFGFSRLVLTKSKTADDRRKPNHYYVNYQDSKLGKRKRLRTDLKQPRKLSWAPKT